MLDALGFIIRVDQGLRTWPQQAALYAQGRTQPGKVVTYAQPGYSWHNYALALDFVPMVSGEPIWDRTNPAYAKTIEIAESLGLVSGSRWPDPKTDFPHLQLTGRFPEAAPDDYCRYLFTEGGLAAVWREVDLSLGIAAEG
jgi:peptidoglycan L-alanyl-D-glutamate endopeptidase CwlK